LEGDPGKSSIWDGQINFTSSLSLPVELPWAGINHLPVGSHVFYPCYSLLLLLGPLPGTTHFIQKMEATKSSEMLVSYHNTA
jgi:hypothetical protein